MIFRVLGERGDNVIKIKLTDNCRQLVPYKLCRKPVFAVALRRSNEGSGYCLIRLLHNIFNIWEAVTLNGVAAFLSI